MNCTTPLCSGTVQAVEKIRQGTYVRFAAAECTDCNALYWLIIRGEIISIKSRLLIDFDERSDDRGETNV
jgi:hypothetical protein